MLDLDDIAIARALTLEHFLDTDLRDPAKSIVVAQIASAREGAIDATRALIEADPFKPEIILRLQNDVRRFRGLIVWLCNQQNRAAEHFANLPAEEQDAVRAFTTAHREINDA